MAAAEVTAPLVDSTPEARVRSAVRGSTLNLAGTALSAFATLALTLVITHGATKEQAGVFFSATSLFVIAVAVGQLGTDTGLVYFCARALVRAEHRLVVDYTRAALLPVLACAVVMVGVLWTWAPETAQAIVPDQPARTEEALRALAPLIPFAGLENVMLSATRGMGTMRANVVVAQLLRPLAQLGLAALIVYAGTGVDLAWSWSLPYALSGVLALLWWRRLTTVHREARTCRPAPERIATVRRFWTFSAPRSLASLAQVAMQRLDIVLVGALAGAGDAAIYAAVTRFVVLGQLARSAVSLAVQPHLAGTLATRSHDEVRTLYQTSTGWLMAVTWPLFLVLVLDGHLLMPVFGHGYASGAGILVLLGVSMLVATLCGDVDVMLIMAGRTRSSMINMLVALGINVGLDLWLIPRHGITGAAIGWACAIVVKNILALVQVAVILRMQPCGRAVITVAALSVICFGCLPGAARIIGSGGVAQLGMLAVAATAYAGGLWAARASLGLARGVSRTP